MRLSTPRREMPAGGHLTGETMKTDCYKCTHAGREHSVWYCGLTGKKIQREGSKEDCRNFKSPVSRKDKHG